MNHVFLYLTKKEASDCELISTHAGLSTIKTKVNDCLDLVRDLFGNDVPGEYPVVLILEDPEAVSLMLEVKIAGEQKFLYSNRWNRLYDTLMENYLSSRKRHVND